MCLARKVSSLVRGSAPRPPPAAPAKSFVDNCRALLHNGNPCGMCRTQGELYWRGMVAAQEGRHPAGCDAFRVPGLLPRHG